MPTNATDVRASSVSQSNIIQATYLTFVIVISIFGNLTIITVIVRKRLLENVTNCFILNLAISDFLNASLKMTTTVAGLLNRDWYPSNAICYFTTPFGVLFGAASVLSLTSVALTRYLCISKPFIFATKMTFSIASSILAGVWCMSIILSFPPVTWRPVGVICRSGAVSSSYYHSELAYLVALWLFVIVLPSAIMLTSYFLIYRITSAQLRRISTSSAFVPKNRQTLRRKRELRAAMVLAVIGGIFILCWFPFFVMQTLHKFASTKPDPMYFKIFLCWMYTNSALNPILLVLFNNEVKLAVRSMFPCRYRVNPGQTICDTAMQESNK